VFGAACGEAEIAAATATRAANRVRLGIRGSAISSPGSGVGFENPPRRARRAVPAAPWLVRGIVISPPCVGTWPHFGPHSVRRGTSIVSRRAAVSNTY
jgi:hypothetical protein